MSSFRERVAAFFYGADGAAKVVPPGGASGWLVAAVSAVMTIFAVVALLFAFTADRIAQGWNQELARSATLRISVPEAQLELQTDAALRVLQTTPGIISAEVMNPEDQVALLEPWMNSTLDLADLQLPRLIAVVETAEGPDAEGLRLRLAGEAPGAVYDSHGRWREPIGQAANGLGRAGIGAMVLSLLTLCAIIMFTAQSAIRINAGAIETLRLIGAKDRFITRAFVRRITIFAFIGALLGLFIALMVAMLINQGLAERFATLRPAGLQWVLIGAMPPLVAVFAFISARTSAMRTLKRLN